MAATNELQFDKEYPVIQTIKTGCTCSSVFYHLVMPTRLRRSIFDADGARDLFNRYAGKTASEINCKIHETLFGANYVSLLVEASPYVSPAVIAQKLKFATAKPFVTAYPNLRGLTTIWTRNFFVTSEHNPHLLSRKERAEIFIEKQANKV